MTFLSKPRNSSLPEQDDLKSISRVMWYNFMQMEKKKKT